MRQQQGPQFGGDAAQLLARYLARVVQAFGGVAHALGQGAQPDMLVEDPGQVGAGRQRPRPGAALDGAAHRHRLARLDQQQIAGADHLGSDVGEAVALLAVGDPWGAGGEGRQLAARPSLSEFLQCGAAGDHQRDQGGGCGFAQGQRAADRQQGDDVHAGRAAAQGEQAVARQHGGHRQGGDGPREACHPGPAEQRGGAASGGITQGAVGIQWWAARNMGLEAAGLV
ncbi:MAG: hypothetical protein QJR07_13365 [Acetobacteraceae bacterium]|nr:hypothetical protein [Acetobacteraceae bacterium]